jgi:hypothetical protein
VCLDLDGHHRRAIRGVVEALHHQGIIAHPGVGANRGLAGQESGFTPTVGETAPALP